MNKQIEIFNALLLIALLSQLAIDVLGATGVYYNAYDEVVFTYSGHEAVLDFTMTFYLYILWMVLFYASCMAMAMKSFLAWFIVPAALLLSFIQMPLSGIYVGTPFESTVGWIGMYSYAICITMAVVSPELSNKFKQSFSKFSGVDP